DRVGSIRRAVVDGLCLGEHAIAVRGRGSARENVDLEVLATGVGVLRLVRDGGWESLRVAGTGKAGHADLVAIVDELCRLLGAHHLGLELLMGNAICHLFLLWRSAHSDR